jgi:TolB-like protein
LGPSEARGSDGGDAEVRKRINNCRLFLPVISQHTQERREEPFRREWTLADEHAHALAKDTPFLVPVCIDATDDRAARVPDSFLGVPWTRLPGGETPPAFCEQVKRLLTLSAWPSAGTGSVIAAPRIPDYELLRLIGRGSYGDVWLARGVTGIYRAIKVVWSERFADAKPFECEFRGLKEFAAISLGESIQLALLHVGRNDEAGFFYYVMELADDAERGREIDPARYVQLTLTELRARRGRLPAEECVTFGVELARVLAGLHAHGLVHRDIKPSNVILVGGVPKLADIGLVAPATDARTFVGTEGFMPPEGPGSPGADVFALGKVLYELSTGFDRRQFPQLPPDLDRLPDHRGLLKLNEVILRACDPLPRLRYPDGRMLLADLLTLQAGRPVRRPAPGRRVALLAAAAAVALAAAWMWLRPPVVRLAQRPEATATTQVNAPLAPVSEKSLAVLPLENLSPDPENAYFTDGMHAEIIATLGRIPDLRVISRNSARYYRDSRASLAEIGRQLGVAYVITGSVRRAENRVRIQLELRRARDEALLWTQTYDKELRDVMGIQSDIADEVARVLQARSASGWLAGAQFMTKDPRAYDFFLRGIGIPNRGFGSDEMRDRLECIKYLEEAMRLDPNFMSAADALSETHSELAAFVLTDPEGRLRHAAEAKKWAERASQLMPGGAGLGALAYYYTRIERDHPRALALAEEYLRARPNDDNAHFLVGFAMAEMGRMDEAVKEQRQAIALDPRNPGSRYFELLYLARLRRKNAWDAALSEYRTMVSVAQGNETNIVHERFHLTGELPASLDDIYNLGGTDRVKWLWRGRRFGEALDFIKAELASPQLNAVERFEFRIWQCDVLRRLDRTREANDAAQAALAVAEKQQGVREIYESAKDRRLVLALARVGRFEEAIAAGRRWVEAARVPDQQVDRWRREFDLADLYAYCHRPRECLALLARLLRVPSGLTVPMLRVDPDWDPVRDDPQFEALLNDPKNNEPL